VAGLATLTGTPLVGREEELARLTAFLRSRRVVTVVGQGGVGKTRLAREFISHHRPPPELSVCALAPVPTPDGTAAAIAESLGFPSVVAASLGLADRDRLLVVDNAEHHLDTVADTLAVLLDACPGLRVLVTSQVPLELADEQVLVLGSLPAASPDDIRGALVSPAVQLFAARAGAVGADLHLDETTVSTIAAICQRLDGLPLGIELAAARTRSLAPIDILRHLDARFELLAARATRGPVRHRSLEAAIDWSYERLDPATQRLFRRMGAFCGPFPAEAAHQVGADPGEDPVVTLDRLDRLVTRSLATTTLTGGHRWYELPESLRLYARRRSEIAGELERCDEGCVDAHVALALAIAARSLRRWSSEQLTELVAAQLNLQEAIRWCLERDRDPQRAFALFVPLWGLVHNHRADGVLELGEQVLARWDDPAAPLWAEVAATTATAAIVVGSSERGATLADRVRRESRSVFGLALASRAAYLAAAADGRDEEALAALDEGLAAAERADAIPFVRELAILRALAVARVDGVAAGHRVAQEARTTLQAMDGPVLRSFADVVLGALEAVRDPEAGAATLTAAVRRAEDASYPWGVVVGHRALGACALAAQDPSRAAAAFRRALETCVALGDHGETRTTLRWVAGLLVVLGHAALARSAAASELTPGVAVAHELERTVLDPLLASLGDARDLQPPMELRTLLAAVRGELDRIAGGDPRADAEAARSPDPAAPEPEAPPGADAQPGADAVSAWVDEGRVWAVTYGGATVRLPHSKGLADLAVLLRQPGREVAATELIASGVDSGDLGPTVDAAARRAYEARILELQAELEEAEDFHDLSRAERARFELDHLLDELGAATGLGGRDRRVGASAERARSAVTWRIRDAIRRLREVHPALGAHLAASVRTGRWCVYAPDQAERPHR
jgi:predicted ATPase